MTQKAFMTVYQAGDKHYAVLQSGRPPAVPTGGRRVFTVDAIWKDGIDELQKKARAEARRRGIDHVNNLDD